MSNKNEFKRRFDEDGLNLLAAMPDWWADLLKASYEDPVHGRQKLVISVRGGYLNAYCGGQSVALIDYAIRKKALQVLIHSAYVMGHGAGYLTFDGVHVRNRDGAIVATYEGPQTLALWMEHAFRKAGEEKRAVAAIVNRHAHVIDVEMALPSNPAEPIPEGRSRRSALRMDVVTVEEDGPHDCRIVFYEAKLFDNDAALRTKEGLPEALSQIGRYTAYFSDPARMTQIVEAYREAAKTLIAIQTMQGHEIDPAMQRLANGARTTLHRTPRILLCGAQNPKRSVEAWEKHLAVLKAHAEVVIDLEPARRP